MTTKRSSHSLYDLWYHFALCTKYRKHIWKTPYTQERVRELFRTIASHYDIELGVVECLPNHIHFTAAAPPRIAPARIIQILKSVSTKLLFEEFSWLEKEYWGGEIWVAGYFVRSIGPGLTKEQIERYVREQSK
jgi:putative transposase